VTEEFFYLSDKMLVDSNALLDKVTESSVEMKELTKDFNAALTRKLNEGYQVAGETKPPIIFKNEEEIYVRARWCVNLNKS